MLIMYVDKESRVSRDNSVVCCLKVLDNLPNSILWLSHLRGMLQETQVQGLMREALTLGILPFMGFMHEGPLIAAVVQLLRRVQLFVTPWAAAHQAPLFSRYLLDFAQIHVY